jgi:hypothetical protein
MMLSDDRHITRGQSLIMNDTQSPSTGSTVRVLIAGNQCALRLQAFRLSARGDITPAWPEHWTRHTLVDWVRKLGLGGRPSGADLPRRPRALTAAGTCGSCESDAVVLDVVVGLAMTYRKGDRPQARCG